MTIKKICRKSFWFQLLLTSVVGMLVYNASVHAEDVQDWMPDPHLRRIVSEALDVESLTIADMQRLHTLISERDEIENLEGLQHAVNLKFLQINKSQVSDLTPLAGLVKLNTLKIDHNPISDLTPLAGLVNLEWLQLNDCQISDLTPLAGLVNLRWLFLEYNQISDVTPIRSLTKLERLSIAENPIEDFSQIKHFKEAIKNSYWRWCFFEDGSYKSPIEQRIENRDFPSILKRGDLLNHRNLSSVESFAAFDFVFGANP